MVKDYSLKIGDGDALAGGDGEVYDPELKKKFIEKRRLKQMKLKKLAELAKDLPEFEHDIYILNTKRERFLDVKEEYTPKQIRVTFYEIMCWCDSLGTTVEKLAEAYNKLQELILEAEIGD